ncbi:MAG: protein kinase [Bauldia sp.]|nr:protein kinase [Bauldia sp.]
MSDQRFRSNHPGVPRQWTLIGEGGNAYVWSDGTQAIKRLKDGAPSEAVSRFKREAEILLLLNEQSDIRIVPVHEVREREGALEIVMERMDGSLENAITSFAGNPERAAAALEPIASTLAAMSARSEPIYHRDLKPTNLLFKESPDHLYLADFGCAFLAEDERLTPAKRAMGAWAYRPPEYSIGRLIDVTEKGDVFCLGKVLWAMINGEPGVVFPGPVWFEPEYDLGRLYPAHPRIHHAMLAVSSAVAINPVQRPTMKQLAEMFGNLSQKQPSSRDGEAMIALLRAQSVMEVEFEQRRAATAAFVRALHGDLHQSIADLATTDPKLLLWLDWHQHANRTPQSADALVEQVAVHESDAPIVNSRFRRIHLNTRFHPPTAGSSVRFVAHIGSEIENTQASSFTVAYREDGVWFERQIGGRSATSGRYTPTLLREFLIEATRHILQAPIGPNNDR